MPYLMDEKGNITKTQTGEWLVVEGDDITKVQYLPDDDPRVFMMLLEGLQARIEKLEET